MVETTVPSRTRGVVCLCPNGRCGLNGRTGIAAATRLDAGDPQPRPAPSLRGGNILEGSESLERLFDRVDTVLLGHGTYDDLSRKWPTMQGLTARWPGHMAWSTATLPEPRNDSAPAGHTITPSGARSAWSWTLQFPDGPRRRPVGWVLRPDRAAPGGSYETPGHRAGRRRPSAPLLCRWRFLVRAPGKDPSMNSSKGMGGREKSATNFRLDRQERVRSPT
jgi:hypothetical protein